MGSIDLRCAWMALALALVSIFGAATLPTGAGAATVQVNALNDVIYRADPGEENKVSLTTLRAVSSDLKRFRHVSITDTGVASLKAGPGCTKSPGVPQRVACTAPAGGPSFNLIGIGMGDRDDRFHEARTQPYALMTVTGGPGNDTINIRRIRSLVLGKGGNDTITTYRSGHYRGGDGNDTLTAIHTGTRLEGDDGNDTLNGGPNGDTLRGGDDDDVITGADGNDLLDGQAGVDELSAGNGMDKVYSKDGTKDELISCGAGTDTLSRDPFDVPQLGDCETLS